MLVYLHKEVSERVTSKEAIKLVFGTSLFCPQGSCNVAHNAQRRREMFLF